jgi:hypothetical protein
MKKMVRVSIDGDGYTRVSRPLNIDTNIRRGYEAISRAPLDINKGILVIKIAYRFIFINIGVSIMSTEILGKISRTILVALTTTQLLIIL